MRLSFRAKLLSLAGITTLTFLVLIGASAAIEQRIERQLFLIEERYVPKLELGPKLDLERLRREFQDAVAAQDVDGLARARVVKDELLAALRSARGAILPADAAAAHDAVVAYYEAAHDVSGRLVAGETGEALVEAMAGMQSKQVTATELLQKATAFDQRELGAAFSAATEAQAAAGRVRLAIGVGCLALLLALTLVFTKSVMGSVTGLASGFERFGKGDFSTPINILARDELGKLAEQANAMAGNLERLQRERVHLDWLKSGVAGLSEELLGELEPTTVATRTVSFLARYLDAPVAAFYALEADGALHLTGGYAADASSTRMTPRFALGEGLVGEAALRREIAIIRDLPSDYLRVRSGLGEAAPRTLALAPVLHAGKVVGVLELATLATFSEQRLELLRLVSEPVAIALEVARNRDAMRELLFETQRQAERLAKQEEELRATNEELQAQQEELRSQQDELRTTNEELISQSEALTRERQALELINIELDEARTLVQRKADELATVSAYKSQFLANMSHELRTPLNGMLLLSNLLAENDAGNLTERQVEFCKTIHSAGHDLLALINQVLDLAKVEAGRQDLQIAPLAVPDLATHAERMFAPLARDKGLELVVEVAPDVPESILTDKRRVEQVVNNLLGNAIKFTERGSVTLRIGPPARGVRFSRPELDPEHTLALSVTDTGIGIASEDQQRIFVPFEQVDLAPDRRYGGTGLGLTIGRQLAALLGGELQLHSAAGEGSTFTLYLPHEHSPTQAVVTPAPAQPASAPAPRANGHDTTIQPGEPHLLVVEDDPAFAKAFGQVIGSSGFKYVIANDGRSALQLAKDLRPSGIVLDVKLPDIDGFVVMEALRADPTTATIPVHFVSALDAGERGMAMGAVGYLTKPASRRDLERVVDSLSPSGRDRERRILIFESDGVVADSLAERLRAEQIEAKRVASAHDVFEAIGRERFSCLVVDLAHPEMEGLGFLRSLRERHTTDALPVVVYTGRALSKVEAQRLEAYVDTVVLKEGTGIDRLLDEIRLFVRRLKQGLPARKAPTPKLTTSVRLEGHKILLVDDDMRTVYALSAVLRSKGAEVLVADTGRVALEVLAAHPEVEVVLMDIMMPEMDGYEAMRRIRLEARFAKLPIIALTAKAMRGDREKCIEMGATDYLPKPIDPDALAVMLHARLSEGARDGA